ncbi:MAG TPA: hypothetical protein VFS43_22965, partial [Polyangiaceae bacterium]|nr:hypothetical protein [Polyangiaceae bacterium]
MKDEASLLREVVERCAKAEFTGVVFVRGERGVGQVYLVSGHFYDALLGSTKGQPAYDQMLAWPTAKLEVHQRLPPRERGSEEPHPFEGPLADRPPVELFRYCEDNALTCKVELRSGGIRGEAAYKLGELLSVSCGGDKREVAVTQMLRWSDGTYRVVLPTVDLPPGVSYHGPTFRSVPAPAPASAPAQVAAAPVPAAPAPASAARAPASAARAPASSAPAPAARAAAPAAAAPAA